MAINNVLAGCALERLSPIRDGRQHKCAKHKWSALRWAVVQFTKDIFPHSQVMAWIRDYNIIAQRPWLKYGNEDIIQKFNFIFFLLFAFNFLFFYGSGSSQPK